MNFEESPYCKARVFTKWPQNWRSTNSQDSLPAPKYLSEFGDRKRSSDTSRVNECQVADSDNDHWQSLDKKDWHFRLKKYFFALRIWFFRWDSVRPALQSNRIRFAKALRSKTRTQECLKWIMFEKKMTWHHLGMRHAFLVSRFWICLSP